MEPSQPVSFEAVAELESIVPNPIPVLEVNDRYILVGAPQQCRLLDTNTFAVSTIPQSMQVKRSSSHLENIFTTVHLVEEKHAD